MDAPKYKGIFFDLNTKEMTKYFKNVPMGYKRLETSFKRHGFNHRQGSGYISDDKCTNSQIGKKIKSIVKENPWLKTCARQFDVLNVDNRYYSLLDTISKVEIKEEDKIKSDIVKLEAKTGQSINDVQNLLNKEQTKNKEHTHSLDKSR